MCTDCRVSGATLRPARTGGRGKENRMKMRFVLLLGGVVLLGVNLSMASSLLPGTGTGALPGTGTGGISPHLSHCTGDLICQDPDVDLLPF